MGSFRVLYAVAVRFVFYVYSEKRGIFSFRAGARGRGCRLSASRVRVVFVGGRDANGCGMWWDSVENSHNTNV